LAPGQSLYKECGRKQGESAIGDFGIGSIVRLPADRRSALYRQPQKGFKKEEKRVDTGRPFSWKWPIRPLTPFPPSASPHWGELTNERRVAASTKKFEFDSSFRFTFPL
jgi:hypothetical protein